MYVCVCVFVCVCVRARVYISVCKCAFVCMFARECMAYFAHWTHRQNKLTKVCTQSHTISHKDKDTHGLYNHAYDISPIPTPTHNPSTHKSATYNTQLSRKLFSHTQLTTRNSTVVTQAHKSQAPTSQTCVTQPHTTQPPTTLSYTAQTHTTQPRAT